MRRDYESWLAFIEARAAMPHAWGRSANDCISFSAGAVKALTGHHRLDIGGRRIRWSDEAGARRLIARHGGLEAMISARFQRLAPAMAARGDLGAVADDEFGLHPMIVEGATLVCPGHRGLIRLPRRRMVSAWSATAPMLEGGDHV